VFGAFVHFNGHTPIHHLQSAVRRNPFAVGRMSRLHFDSAQVQIALRATTTTTTTTSQHTRTRSLLPNTRHQALERPTQPQHASTVTPFTPDLQETFNSNHAIHSYHCDAPYGHAHHGRPSRSWTWTWTWSRAQSSQSRGGHYHDGRLSDGHGRRSFKHSSYVNDYGIVSRLVISGAH
jgi:hypothetical protein